MALESGNGRSSGKCPLTSNGYHLHSRLCCPHLTSVCDVSKKCYIVVVGWLITASFGLCIFPTNMQQKKHCALGLKMLT
jgi:hypothetical protein